VALPVLRRRARAAVSAGFATADALLMGRVLYDEWAAYWPEHADEPFGDVMNSIKKYVVSNSLQAAEWQNSAIISGDLAQRLTDILLVHPIVVGGGLARLFPPDEPSVPLELMSAQTFKTGVLNLSYAPAKD
jgi:dihydrofolate reductase